MRALGELIEENLARGPNEVREKLREVKTYHQVELPAGERAIYAVPRDYDWQLPYVEAARHHACFHGDSSLIPPDNKPISMVMRQHKLWADQANVGYHLFPQQLIVHKNVTEFLQQNAVEHMIHCPEETTWVQEHLGAAAAIARYDVSIYPDGRVGIGEIDLEASLWGNAQEYNQIVETHVLGFIDRLADKGYEMVSTEMPEIGQGDERKRLIIGQVKTPHGRTVYFDPMSGEGGSETYAYHYQHNDAGVYGTQIPFVAPEDLNDTHVAIPRGRRRGTFYYAPERRMMGFNEYMKMVEQHSLIPGRLRDCKVPLAAMGMGVLATREHAFEAIEEMIDENPDARFAVKQAMAARTSDMAIVRRNSGRRRQGEYTLAQAAKRMSRYEGGYDDLVVVQPAFKHPSMEELGLEFSPTDAADLARYSHVSSRDVERFVPGQESAHNVLARIFIIYDKTQPEFATVIGGTGVALPGEIVHNTKRAAVFPLFCEGVMAYPNVIPYHSLEGQPQDRSDFNVLHRRIANCAMRTLRPGKA